MATPLSTNLLGPPEIYSTTAHKLQSTPMDVDNPLLDQMLSNFNDPNLASLAAPIGHTDNNARTYLSTGNPCLDFFCHTAPNTRRENVIERLQLSWEHDPLTTLKLICNLRGVRGKGKGDKRSYYTAALWLHKLHPKTFALNLPTMASFGYFKDLPEILFRLLEAPDVRKRMVKQWRGGRSKNRRGKGAPKKKQRKQVPREIRVKVNLKRNLMEQKRARKERKEKKVTRAKKAIEMYKRDPDYKFLYDRVSDFFAERLKADVGFLNSGELKNISLAAKWCPSLDSSFDKHTLLCEGIARKLFPKDSEPEYQEIEDAHYAYRVRDRMRKEVLVPLRKALELPEVYIGAKSWGSIPYNRVASVAMKTYKEKFLKHDQQRFEEYLEQVKAGNAKIAAGALLPHEIIWSLYDPDGGQVAELQWKRMVDDLAQKGKLKDCLAICDVSSSMAGVPMEVSVALGVLVSELSEVPWKGKLITFSTNPKLQLIHGEDLESKAELVRNMESGTNCDFQKVFDLILHVVVKGKLREDQMIKRLFVFSGMEFDQASARPWETDYEAITRKFEKAGFGNCVPEIVFWNLKDSKATPVPGTQEGVALVSGFSKNLMTLFLEETGKLMNPMAVMEAAISGEEYKDLVVLD